MMRPLYTRYTAAEIALRNDGRPFLAILGNAPLLVYDCSDTSCEKGELRLLDSDGANPRPYVRTDGRPAVLYERSGSVYVYNCSDSNCTDGTAQVTGLSQLGPLAQLTDGTIMVFTTSGSNIGRLICDDDLCLSVSGQASLLAQNYSSVISAVAMTEAGLARLTYRNDNGNLGLLLCNNALCSGRTVREIVVSGTVSSSSFSTTSVAIQGNGNPVLAFRDSSAGRLTVYTCDDVSCVSGVEEDISNRAGYSATVLAGEGRPTVVLSYGSTSDLSLWLTQCLSPDCSSSTSKILDNNADPGRVIRAVVRRDGSPFVVSYRDGGRGGPLIYSCSAPTCPTPLPSY